MEKSSSIQTFYRTFRDISKSVHSFTKVEEVRNEGRRATIGSSLGLLGNGYIAMMVLGIFLVVGIDVGINSVSGQFLMNKFQTAQEWAEKGRSVYFFGKMLGTFLGAVMLAMLSSRKFLLWTSILGLASILALLVVPTEMTRRPSRFARESSSATVLLTTPYSRCIGCSRGLSVRTGRKVSRPTCKVTNSTLTPFSRIPAISSGVKRRPAVGAATLPATLA